MTCFRVGQYGTSSTPQFEASPAATAAAAASASSALSAGPRPQPFVDFSSRQDRASLMSNSAALSGVLRKTSSGPRRKRRRTRTTRVRIVKGKVALRVSGFPRIQRLGASQLVRFVPLNKLRAAAKKVLGKSVRRRAHSLTRRRRVRRGRRIRRRRSNLSSGTASRRRRVGAKSRRRRRRVRRS